MPLCGDVVVVVARIISGARYASRAPFIVVLFPISPLRLVAVDPVVVVPVPLPLSLSSMVVQVEIGVCSNFLLR